MNEKLEIRTVVAIFGMLPAFFIAGVLEVMFGPLVRTDPWWILMGAAAFCSLILLVTDSIYPIFFIVVAIGAGLENAGFVFSWFVLRNGTVDASLLIFVVRATLVLVMAGLYGLAFSPWLHAQLKNLARIMTERPSRTTRRKPPIKYK